ncbi:maleylacetoacetate isomerase [uncultured Roseobacter sp.]|uniref:maleylacetoacetate isomerase n=1 Tax=uncultured Roseobacter sp. TaxID=114847 RepID=UPI0026363672|nr:maleylacetoacetate isomerase [uncultured Roseobacter sp.]
MITLHHDLRSSASYRVRIALGLADAPWQGVIVDLKSGAQRTPEHLARNPQGLVPVLEIDGHRLTQSLAIIEYLDETRHLGLLPRAAPARARVRALSYAIAMEIQPLCNLSVAQWVAQASDGAIATQPWMQRFITSGLTAYEAMLDDAPFSYGERISLADICLVPQVYNAARWGVDLAQFPRIRRVHETLQSLPAVRSAHPDNTPPAS